VSITIIAAVSLNGIIGNSKMSKLPWKCPEEMQHFRDVTMGKIIVMGRKTAEEVGALPGRNCIVLSDKWTYELQGFTTMTLNDFLLLNEDNMATQYFVCGGAEIYKAVTPYASQAMISYLDFEAYGDIEMPTFDRNSWRKINAVEKKKFTTVTTLNSNRVVYSKIVSQQLVTKKVKEKSL
jgi:dihydrofolate reductase